MAIQIKANLNGLGGAIQVNGSDAMTFDENGNVVVIGTLTAAGGGGSGSGSSETINGDLLVTGAIDTAQLRVDDSIAAVQAVFSGDVTSANLGTGFINCGTVYASGNVTAVDFISTSDARLKTDVTEINGLDMVRAIRPVGFKWSDSGTQSYGVLAQELREAFPTLVSEKGDGYLAVSYTPIIAMLVDAVQKLEAEVNELKKAKSTTDSTKVKRLAPSSDQQ